MPHRIEVTTKPDFTDAAGEATRKRIHEDLGITNVNSVKTVNVYTLDDGHIDRKLDILGRNFSPTRSSRASPSTGPFFPEAPATG